MPGRESAAETELSCEDAGSNNASKAPCVIARICRMSAANSKKIQHRALGLEDRATPNCADFDGWHGDADLEVAIVTDYCQW